MKRPAGAALGHLMFASGLNTVLLGDAAVVVAFHRVNDYSDPSGLSVGRALFERYCEFFKRYFVVVPLADLLTKVERRESIDRHLAITFDDGYLDNFANAMPILEKLALPATFFVVSNWIGSDVVAWWDRQESGRHRWMTWEHVKEMTARGFDVGAHTRTHVDLGAVTGATAIDEIHGARHDLEAALGRPVDLFAYPYGGPRNMAEANREFVKAAGFRCCCSCFGGLMPPSADPFRLRRVAISGWFRSPHQFGLSLVREPISLTA